MTSPCHFNYGTARVPRIPFPGTLWYALCRRRCGHSNGDMKHKYISAGSSAGRNLSLGASPALNPGSNGPTGPGCRLWALNNIGIQDLMISPDMPAIVSGLLKQFLICVHLLHRQLLGKHKDFLSFFYFSSKKLQSLPHERKESPPSL